MNSKYQHIIENFKNINVLVIGDTILDSYLKGSTDRLCREAPVPIVDIKYRDDAPGGAANTALNIKSLGGNVTFLTVTGDDYEAKVIHNMLDLAGVNMNEMIKDPERRTLTKQRIVAGNQLLVRFDYGTTNAVSNSIESQLIDRIIELFDEQEVIVVSDYGYGILTSAVIHTLAFLQRRSPRVVVVDAKSLQEYAILHPTAVKPNYEQFTTLVGVKKESAEKRIEQVTALKDRVLEITNADIAAVTLDSNGALICEQDKSLYRTYAKPAPDSKAAGAGDTFVSTLALALGANATSQAAAELAQTAATIVVHKDGTALCTNQELCDYLMVSNKIVQEKNVIDTLIQSYKHQGKRIVFTNGCFDIIHPGHVTYLNQAKAEGDILIVGVNSDESIKKLKGDSRPINSLNDRLQVLSALSSVDHVIPFTEESPINLIELIKPDIFVKGGDYTLAKLKEADVVKKHGGKIKLLPYVKHKSTTNIIQKIQTVSTHDYIQKGGALS